MTDEVIQYHTKKEFTEKVECGDIITTQYFNEANELVRQDKNVIVDAKWLAMQGLVTL